jgi:hypothetical protein
MKRLFLILVLISSFAIGQVASLTLEGLETFKVVASHKEGNIVYPLNPPVGGAHNPAWQNCGIYDKAVRNENVVHSLEHGAVWITYKSDITQSEIQTLRTLIKGQLYTVLSPYLFGNKLKKPIYIVAWGVRLGVNSASDPRLPIFITRFKNNSKITPEFGAPCTGAIGNPIQQ